MTRPTIEKKLERAVKHAEAHGIPYPDMLRSMIAKWRTGVEAARAKAGNEQLDPGTRAVAAQNARDANFAVRMFELELERVTADTGEVA